MEFVVKFVIEKSKDINEWVLVIVIVLILKEEKLYNFIYKLDNEYVVDLLFFLGLVEFLERFEFNEEIVLFYFKE